MMKTIRGKKLTSKEAARVLGVSEATVKRWADSGRLPMAKTVGGHRRFSPEDIATFKRALIEIKRPHALQRSAAIGANSHSTKALRLNDEEVEALGEKLFRALLDGDSEETSALIANLHLHGQTVAAIADDHLCPAMRRIGDLWHRGELSVAQEHVATRTAAHALRNLQLALKTFEPKMFALCCSVEEDFHELPVQLAVLALEEGDVEVFNLGTNTPFYALAEAVERFRPNLVCVSSTMLPNLDRAAREYEEFHEAARRTKASIVLGGEGFSSETVRGRFPSHLYAENYRQLEEFIASMTVDESEDADQREGEDVGTNGEEVH